MTQKEIEIINAINCNGLDNMYWGIGKACDIYGQYGACDHSEVPAHIYIYRDEDEGSIFGLIEPDFTLLDRFGSIIDLYYIIEEKGGEE